MRMGMMIKDEEDDDEDDDDDDDDDEEEEEEDDDLHCYDSNDCAYAKCVTLMAFIRLWSSLFRQCCGLDLRNLHVCGGA